MKQRFLSICTALCLCLTLLPTAAWAAGGDTAGGDVTLPPGGDGTVGEPNPGSGDGDGGSADDRQVSDWGGTDSRD